MVTICCVCNKTKTALGWIEQDITDHEPPSHGYCPVCAEKVLEEIKGHRRQQNRVSA